MVYSIVAGRGDQHASGTGFIVCREQRYFLVTAKHCFCSASTLENYMVPNYDNSFAAVVILDERAAPISTHSLTRDESRTIHYRSALVTPSMALDVAVLELRDLPSAVAANSFPYESLAANRDIDYTMPVRLEGFPSNHAGRQVIAGTYLPEDWQRGLNEAHAYYFILQGQGNIVGLSGGPIFQNETIFGIVVGEHHDDRSLNYGVYAKYARDLIDDFFR